MNLNMKLPHLFIPNKTATMVHEFAVEDLRLGGTTALVPEFAVKDLPLGRTLMMMMMMSWNFYRKILNVLIQDPMHMWHFEICILNLIKKLISRKLMDQLKWNFVCYFQNLTYTVLKSWNSDNNIKMAISEFNRTQSQCPLNHSVILLMNPEKKWFAEY